MSTAYKIEALCLKAQEAIGAREWDKAKLYYLQALGLKSDVPDIHYGLATVYFQLRELTSAAHHFREVTRLDPLRAGAYVNLGAVLNLLDELDDALTALRRGIQLDPKRIEGYYNLGLVHRRKSQLDLAIQAYKEALRLNPRMADAQLNLGNIYIEKGHYKQAIVHYEQAGKLRPGWSKAADGLTHAREALELEAQPAKSKGAPALADDSLARVVDPALHHTFLTLLHQAAIDSEEKGKEFEQILAREVEPAIKELSSCLLQLGSRTELEACVAKFEAALQHMHTLQQDLQLSVARVKNCGDHFPSN